MSIEEFMSTRLLIVHLKLYNVENIKLSFKAWRLGGKQKGIPSKVNRRSKEKEVGEHRHVISRMMEVQYSCRGEEMCATQ